MKFGTPDPLYNALVYVPNGPVQAFKPGVTCDKCGTEVSGTPLVSEVTGPDGKFVLQNAPCGMNIPLVIQLGRWRRQIVIQNVACCRDNALTAEQTRLPRNKTEGDIPLMAMVTGNVDALECVLRKIGIDDAEFTVPSKNNGNGRVQFYIANGSDAAGGGAPNESQLWGDATELAKFDMVLFACEGGQFNEQVADQQRVVDYTSLGGRVFATHYSYVWLYNIAPFSGTGTWNVHQADPASPLTGIIDQTFPKGKDFATWLGLVGAQSQPGQILINQPRHDLDGVNAPSQRWIYSQNPNTIQHYTFNTPVGVAANQQCGRVLFSDFHVNDAMSRGTQFPSECTVGPLTPQEKVLEFMLFDLASCIQPDNPMPMCTPRNCAQANANCGPVGDGCGNLLDCGPCPMGQTCGGGGKPSQCGMMPCMGRSCMVQNIKCGPAGDGCGNLIQCGSCPMGQTCGGGGVPGVCGSVDGGACVGRTCKQQNIQCGPAGDGCGNQIDCGPCPPGQTCGGGGVPNQCGMPKCIPVTCQQQNANCGLIGDGCGGVIDCGPCPMGFTCGGGGIANHCAPIGG
jgi:hypothetical protein